MSDVSKVLHDELGVPQVNLEKSATDLFRVHVPARYRLIVDELDKLVGMLPETQRDAAIADALHYLLSLVLHSRGKMGGPFVPAASGAVAPKA